MWSLTPLYGGGFVVAMTQLTMFYYGAAALIHWAVPALMDVQVIQVKPRRDDDIRRDAFASIGPLAIKAVVWTFVEYCYRHGWGLLYAGPVTSFPQVLYLLLTVAVLDLFHDAWFYWTHRLLHWGPLYRTVHYQHHRSQSPSAFTGYSFHLLEAALVFANEAIMVFLLPVHVGLHRWYHLFTTVIHEGGHAGYEISPFIPHVMGLLALVARGAKRSSPALNTVQHHDMHHRFPRHHFSLYFTHWDRWCGTLHPTYDSTVEQHFNNVKAWPRGSDDSLGQDGR